METPDLLAKPGEIFRYAPNERCHATLRRTGYYSGTVEVFSGNDRKTLLISWNVILPRYLVFGTPKDDDEWEQDLIRSIDERLNRTKAP